jgi:hypothetical protein
MAFGVFWGNRHFIRSSHDSILRFITNQLNPLLRIFQSLSRFQNSRSIEYAPILHFSTVLGNTRIFDSVGFHRCIHGTTDHYQSLKQLRNRLDSRKIAMIESVRSVWPFPERIRIEDDWTII